MIKKLRLLSLIFIHLLILAHIYIFGDKIIGSIDFQEFFHAFIKHGILNAGGILVILAFVTTLIFGRFFCGWACHFGAVQELSWWLLKKIGINPITINSKLVTLLPFVILLNFYIIPNLVYAFNGDWQLNLTLNQPRIWTFLPGWIIGILTFLIDGFLIVYFLGRKGFCRFLCPWGAFLKFPNSLAMFKVRKTSKCTLCHECTTNCPVGIDVSYEINKFGKVINTNCTSCLICTSDCPSNSLSYKFKSPIKEDFKLSQFIDGNQYNHHNIKHLFRSVKSNDKFLFVFTIIFSYCIDGLYGIGHFMALGIGIISSFILIQIKNHPISSYKILINSVIISMFLWHGIIKYSLWRGLDYYNDKNFIQSIAHLEFATSIYPKKVGKFHLMLGDMYYLSGNKEKARKHALIANQINPDYSAPKEMLLKINSKHKK